MTTKVGHSSTTMSDAIRYASRYHAWVFQTFAPHLRRGTALEIGSGHGAYSRLIAAKVDSLIVSDIDPIAIDKIREELQAHSNVSFLVMDGIDEDVIQSRVDNIILVNLLEHIEDDAAFLHRCHATLQPSGVVVVYAPAFPLLYSRLDRDAGHFRRYTRASIRRLLQNEGFVVEHVRYVNAVGFFGWWANKVSRSEINSNSTNWQIEVFDQLIPAIRYVDRALPFIGQSVVIVARKRS